MYADDSISYYYCFLLAWCNECNDNQPVRGCEARTGERA